MALYQVKLNLYSNIDRYVLFIREGVATTRVNFYKRNNCIVITSERKEIYITLSPFNKNYIGNRVYKIDGTAGEIKLYFNFRPRLTAPTLSFNRFTLTDRNYGLKLNGNLYFRLIN